MTEIIFAEKYEAEDVLHVLKNELTNRGYFSVRTFFIQCLCPAASFDMTKLDQYLYGWDSRNISTKDLIMRMDRTGEWRIAIVDPVLLTEEEQRSEREHFVEEFEFMKMAKETLKERGIEW